MKSILTVIGKDQVGIIAGISSELQKYNINILNVNQTIMNGYFTMIMMLEHVNKNESFEKVKKALQEKGKELKVEVKIQNKEIFDSMHSL
ncbi:MAG: ACT domain-containing protein [Clostridiaceae bacterium]|nr:ACT domain-containing protein [Clostridiaceae bacterium]